MSYCVTPIKFVIGSRKLMAVPRNLVPVSFGLDHLVSATMPAFPPEDDGADGYRILSAPEADLPKILAAHPGHIIGGFQAYQRYYIDMAGDFAGYLARFSSKTRSTFNRKRRKLAELSGGTLDLREYHKPEQIAEFMEAAVPLSRRTYQTRLLDAGIPEGEAAEAGMRELAANDALRAYLLFMDGKAISYLYLPIQDGIISYAFLGYDPDFAQLSTGTVLQLEAMERLFAENRYRYFDFTEGEGAHKAMFGTDSIAACSFFLLKPSAANRLLMGALNGFDQSVAVAKTLASRSGALANMRKLLRG